MKRVDLTVFHDGQSTEFQGVSIPLELGRRRQGDKAELKVLPSDQGHRIAIVPVTVVAVPREVVRVESDGNELRLINIHGRYALQIEGRSEPVRPGEQIVLRENQTITARFTDTITVRFSITEELLSSMMDPSGYRTLQFSDTSDEDAMGGLSELLTSESGQLVLQMVRTAVDVVQKVAGSDEYFETAVESAAMLSDLDRSFLILFDGEEWKVRAKFSRKTGTSIRFNDDNEYVELLPSGSEMLREQVLRDKLPVIFDPNSSFLSHTGSISELDRAVAAPMLDDSGEVIGILYGDRQRTSELAERPIEDLHAALLEVIAGAVASGLARRREQSLRSAMTQFFSPSVTDQLEQNNDLLSGRNAEVTVLFCDIRGFSTVAEMVGSSRTIEWINDVLTELSHCVLETDGVLVDYIGDELMAMWGAPTKQADHAARACRAACSMLGKVEILRDRWDEIMTDRFGLGIGINTGKASVGNTGSRVKFKYGPLGNTVNVASRIQGMTKPFGVPTIVSESTKRAFHASPGIGEKTFAFRQLAQVQPLGVSEVVSVYELSPEQDRATRGLKERYEKALGYYHDNNLTSAAREIASLVHEYPNDVPSVQLLARVVDAMTKRESKVDPVVRFTSK